MASIKKTKRKNGSVSFQIVYSTKGVKGYLSLGSSYSEKEVVQIAVLVDRLVDANVSGCALDRRTSALLGTASADLRERLEKAGLVQFEKRTTLGELFDEYWESEYYELKPCTQSSKRQARRRFFEFANPNESIDSFDKRSASAFVKFLSGRIGEATRAGTVRDVRRIFNFAKERDLVQSNPFDGIARGSFQNKKREYFVSRQDYESLLEACPSQQWRTLLALYRIGGLRKNEALSVQWADIDWERGRLLVHSPKTERYKGRETRVIPLFPELRVELEKLFEQTENESSPYVVSSNRTTVSKHIERIVFFAGLTRWERLIQNLRSSRANEIAREFGTIAEAEWIGHSERTARDHYLHILDEEYDRAVRGCSKSGSRENRDPQNDPLFQRNTANFDTDSVNRDLADYCD